MSNPPSSGSAALQEALAHHQAGRLREAEVLYRAILETTPNDPNALRMLGLLAMQVGRNDIAADLLRQAIVVLPENATLHSELGELCRRLGQLEQAAAACRDAVRLDPNLFDAHYNLGVILQQQRDLPGAIASYRAALHLNPAHAAAHYNLGNALADHGQLEDAIASYRNAIRLRPDYAEAHGNLGLALHARGDLNAAVACFQHVINLQPKDVIAHTSLGNVYRDQTQFDKAIAAYQQALALKPEDAAANNNLGKLFHDTGRLEEAITHYKAAIAAAPDRAEAYQNLGMAYEKLGRRDRAIAMYTEALHRGALSPEARYHMAALTGEGAPAAAPLSHVVQVFDELAETFDHHLVKKLKYRTPQLLYEAVLAAVGGSHAQDQTVSLGDILDLGCGTGLCGPLFAPHAGRLVGVDLSPAMIEKARVRDLYDELLVGDMMEVLGARPNAVDLAIAADVLVYFGDLGPVFAAVRAALRAGGRFAFSVEALEGEEYRLFPTRRYAHSAAYLERVATEHGFAAISLAPAVLRREAGQDVHGYIAVFGVPPSGGSSRA